MRHGAKQVSKKSLVGPKKKGSNFSVLLNPHTSIYHKRKQPNVGKHTDSHEPSWGTTMALNLSSVRDRADSNMQVNEVMFKVQVYHVMIFVYKQLKSPHYIAINLPILSKVPKKTIYQRVN